MPRKSAFKCYFGCTPLNGVAHNFPPPKFPNMDKFNQWKMVLSETDMQKDDIYIFNNIRICDNHFEKCYQTATGRLTKNAIPTLNIASSSVEEKKGETQAFVCQASTSESEMLKPVGKSIEPATSTSVVPIQKAQEKATKVIFDTLARKCCKHQTGSNTEHTKLKLKLLKLRQKCNSLNQQIRKALLISQTKSFVKAVEKLREPAAIFTKMQLRNASIKPRGRRYTTKEKILCLTIYKQSQKGYNLLRKLFELPSKRSLQKILQNICIRPGLNDEIFKSLIKTVNKLPQERKLCTLIFDEVALTPGLYYQKSWDEIVGFEDVGDNKTKKIADHALVFMIKSIKGKYKQPICFTFCQSATKSFELKKIIVNVIRKLHETGLKVIATVCDQSATNVSAISSLISETKAKYSSEQQEYKSLAFEIDGIKIFPIFDTPHLLKGMRNNLLTKDLRFIQDGVSKIAKWEHLKMLLDADVGEDDIRMLSKLTEAHVNKDKIPKMKVSYAAQVFSQRVSATMRFLAKHEILPKECVATADLLLVIDKLFDSFNGHSYQETQKKFKCALKLNSPHFKLWDELLPILRSMQFLIKKKESDGTVSNKFMQVPSIKHWINNINVFKEMFKYLINEHGISSLLTRNFNQDPIENFFCNIRSNGVRNTSPTCLQFVGAFKTLLVNNFSSAHSVGANCEQDSNKALRPLKELINKKNENLNNEQSTEPINVDVYVEYFMQTSSGSLPNNINKEAKRYVAGYIVKKTLKTICKTCHCCRLQLISTMPPKNVDYILERDCTKKSLIYPSEAFCALLDDVCKIIQLRLNEEPHKKYLKETIIQLVDIFCNKSLFSCEVHKELLGKKIMETIINVVVYSWCTTVNRLLKGKETECDSNEIKLQAIRYYRTHRKIKK